MTVARDMERPTARILIELKASGGVFTFQSDNPRNLLP
jgi:hypothetical protein